MIIRKKKNNFAFKFIKNNGSSNLNIEKPKKITAVFDYDYNINILDEAIKQKFAYNKNNYVNILRDKLEFEKLQMEKNMTIINKNIHRENIDHIKREISEIESGIREREYKEESAELLNSYNDLGPSKYEISVDTGVEQYIDDNKERRLELIGNYIDIARKYIECDIIRRHTLNEDTPQICPSCNQIIEETTVTDSEIEICPYCYMRLAAKMKITQYDVTNHVDYEGDGNFKKFVEQFRGSSKSMEKIPNSLFDDIDNYFSSKGVNSDIIRKAKFTDKGRKEGSSIQMIIDALYETGYSVFYNDHNLIGHMYWGWKLPDIKKYEDEIMDIYQEVQKAYKNIDKERSSNLFRPLLLLKILQLLGLNYDLNDFKPIKMRETIEDFDRLWRKTCELCDDPRIYYTPTI
jgi:hypothetical protein